VKKLGDAREQQPRRRAISEIEIRKLKSENAIAEPRIALDARAP
jgi:hypothetical protein